MTTLPEAVGPEDLKPLRMPRSTEQASAILGAIGEHERIIRDIHASYAPRLADVAARSADLAEELAGLQTEIALRTEPHQVLISRSLKQLSAWYQRNVDTLGIGREIKLATGSLKSKLDGRWAVKIIGDEALAVAQVRRRGRRYVRISITLNKVALSDNFRRFRRIAELAFTKNDVFRVAPNNLGDAEKPNEDRLSIVGEVITAPTEPPKYKSKKL